MSSKAVQAPPDTKTKTTPKARRIKRSPIAAASATASLSYQLPLLSLSLDILPPITSEVLPAEKRGAVFTRPWVVRLLLDLAGYIPERNLASYVAVEPAAGSGAFLVEMVSRLVRSCRLHGLPLSAAALSLRAYEIDAASADQARMAVTHLLASEGVERGEAEQLTSGWVLQDDYLAAAPALEPVDFVIGNPPYVRLEDVAPASMSLYRQAYQTMTGRADLYVGFYEAALRSLKPAGVCAFICADRWMRNQYGAELRRLITSGPFAVETVLEMHDANAFEDEVSAYPAITVVRRRSIGAAGNTAQTTVAWAGTGLEGVDSSTLAEALSPGASGPSLVPSLSVAHVSPWFSGSDPWPHVAPDRLALLRRLEASFGTLEDSVTGTKVGIGVATGLDRAFISRDPVMTEAIERECLLPLALASDVKADSHLIEWSGNYLADPWHATDENDLDARFPRLRAYLDAHGGGLRARHIAKANPARWFRTIDRVDHSLVERHKLYLPDIKGRISPVLDAGNTYPHHNLYVVTSETWDLEVLGGLLLSDVAQFFVECYAVRMRGGYLRFQAQYLRRIRLPRPESLSDRQRSELVAAFMNRDSERATSAAMSAYGMSSREIRLLCAAK